MKKEAKLLVPIDSVKAWENNPREISPKDFEDLKNKVKKWGIWKPFLIWESKGQVLGGNSRYKVCKELGHKEIWVEYREPKDDAEALEMAIADNESSGEWIRPLLIKQLELQVGKIELNDYKIDLGQIRLHNLINVEAINPVEMYQGLADFNQKDTTSFKSLLVHFDNEEDYNEFAKLIGQKLSLKTKYAWFPEHLDKKQETYE